MEENATVYMSEAMRWNGASIRKKRNSTFVLKSKLNKINAHQCSL